jgi:hypothetical protein
MMRHLATLAAIATLPACTFLRPTGLNDLPPSALRLERPSLALQELRLSNVDRAQEGPFVVTRADLVETDDASPFHWLESYCRARGLADRQFAGSSNIARLLCTN